MRVLLGRPLGDEPAHLTLLVRELRCECFLTAVLKRCTWPATWASTEETRFCGVDPVRMSSRVVAPRITSSVEVLPVV